MPDKVPYFHRRSVRLKEYDYSQPGAYFVTLNTQARACIFGEIHNGIVSLSHAGEIVKIVWQLLPNYFPIRVDESGIMPNHFHGIIVIEGADPRTPVGIGKGESGGNNPRLPKFTQFPPDSPRPEGETGGPMEVSPGMGRSDGGSHEPMDKSAERGKGEAGGKNVPLPKSTPFPPASPLPNGEARESKDESAGSGRGEACGKNVRFPQSTLLPHASPLPPNDVEEGKIERPAGTVSGSLGAIIQTFKSMTTHRINALQKTPGGIVWQRNYYEHVIRNEKEWENIRLYIQVNPLHRAEDEENPSTLMR